MGGLLASLVSLTGPIVWRVLAALGLAVVTIKGVDVAIEGLIGIILGHLKKAPMDILQLAGLWGAWDALGYIFGGVAFAVAYWSLTQAQQILGSVKK